MSVYIIAGIVTFIFTTILTIAGVGAAFILIPIFLALKIPLLTAMSTALLLNSIAMIFAGSMMLFYRVKEREIEENSKKLVGYGIGVGAIAGYLGGLLGVGGGNFIVPVLVWLGFNPKKASATTAFIVIFSSFSGFLGHVALGNVNIKLLFLCAIGSISGALLGAYLMKEKLNRRQVKIIIGIILYLIAAKIIFKLIK